MTGDGEVRAIVTVPPYASFASEVAAHPIVAGLRLNTVMPIKETPVEVLERLRRLGQPVWVDLKGRQLRVVGAAVPPFTEVCLNHAVRVRDGAFVFFGGGREHGRIATVNGHRLILEDGPRRVIGPGESVNIVDETLAIEGTLTDADHAYLAAMRALDMRHLMLSYVELEQDVAELRALAPQAQVVLKIESQRGLRLVREHGAQLGRLLAARGDLYVEVARPHEIIAALRAIRAADQSAIAASRIFPSLAAHPVPECAEICDVAFLLELGYRTFLLGDEVCLRRDSVIAALNLLASVAGVA